MTDSNIYYPERRLMRHAEQPKSLLGRFFGKFAARPALTSAIITTANVQALLGLPYIFTTLNNELAPFCNFLVRTQELWYEHEDLGKVFIPRNIYMWNNKQSIYIVELDGECEVRDWTANRLKPLNDPEKKIHYPVENKELLADVEKSFAALLIRNELLPAPQGDTRYFERGLCSTRPENGGNRSIHPNFPLNSPQSRPQVEGTPLDPAALGHMLFMLKARLPEAVIKDVVAAAQDPEAFFADNKERLFEAGWDAPYKDLYRSLLVLALRDRDYIATFDWKESMEEIEAGINALHNNPTSFAFPETLDIDEDSTACDTLPIAETLLREQGLALLDLDTGSDEYTIMIVPLEQADEFINTAAKCGLKVRFASEA